MTNSDNGPVDARTVASQLDATDGMAKQYYAEFQCLQAERAGNR